jgi:HAD superfamily hydrolase (TIGR01509 family)
MIKAILFDIDGVLLNSDDVLAKVFADAVESAGFPRPSREQVLRYNGLSAFDWLAALMPQATQEQVKKATASIPDRYVRSVSAEHLMPRALETITGLKKMGVKVGIVTNQTVEAASHNAAILGIPQDCVAFLSAKFREKPHPDLMVEALAKLGVKKEDAVYVGDTQIDIETGINSGVRTVILENEENKNLRAEKIKSLTDLLKMVGK